ncbi:MAG: hypothetical protein KGH98_05130 [Candidatus Micrarchaeota archaeon]|nr:hypothetical protein [Candidatus Micrarchaeota archaeon]
MGLHKRKGNVKDTLRKVGNEVSNAIDSASDSAMPLAASHGDLCPSCIANFGIVAFKYVKPAIGAMAQKLRKTDNQNKEEGEKENKES